MLNKRTEMRAKQFLESQLADSIIDEADQPMIENLTSSEVRLKDGTIIAMTPYVK